MLSLYWIVQEEQNASKDVKIPDIYQILLIDLFYLNNYCLDVLPYFTSKFLLHLTVLTCLKKNKKKEIEFPQFKIFALFLY